ncbi:hypothetical protein C8R47DRAFT_1208958 [Mycena vitilis]|nr:hypothetical protein C8R47DRAFT_1208958 [Mycena vitilis]
MSAPSSALSGPPGSNRRLADGTILVEIFKIRSGAYCWPKTKIQIHFQELGASVYDRFARYPAQSSVSFAYWRQIMHNTARLWAQVVVDVPQLDKVTPRYLDVLEALLARFPSLPISVAFDPPESAQSNPAYADLARTMAPTARRWKVLKIHFLHLINLHPAAFEALERLRIDIGYYDFGPKSISIPPLTSGISP